MAKKLWAAFGIVLGILLLVGVVWSFVALNSANDAIDNLAVQNDELSVQVENLNQDLDVAEASLLDKDAAYETLEDELEAVKTELTETKTQLEEAEDAVEEQIAETETQLAGKAIDDLFLGDTVSFKLDDNDLDQLFDGEIEFDDEDYDVHEEFVALAGGKSVILYSGVDDEELGADPAYGLVAKGALEYRYVFDDPIDMTAISDDEPLALSFLGEEFEIISINANELEFRSGEERVLREGDAIEVDGKEIVLEILGDTEAYVGVDGEYAVIDEYDTETINGIDVRVENIVSKDYGLGVATLVIGEDTILEQKSNDEWLDVEDSEFKFRIESSGDDLEALVVYYDEKRDELDDEFPALLVGDEIAFPYDFITVRFNKVVNTDYITFNFEFDGFEDETENAGDVDNEECGLISASADAIEVLDEEVDEVYVCKNGKAYYADNSGDWYEADVTDVFLVNDETTVQLKIGGADRLRFEGLDVLLRIDTKWADARLGAEENDAESGDILFGNDGIGTVEYDFLTPYGAIVDVPEDNADADEFTLRLPADKLEVELFVY